MSRTSLKLTIILSTANVIVAAVLLSRPILFATSLCHGINAPAHLLEVWLELMLPRLVGLNWPFSRLTTALVCITLQWLIIGSTFHWSRSRKDPSHNPFRFLFLIVASLAISVFLLIAALWPLEISYILISHNSRGFIRNAEFVGQFIEGVFDLVWAGLFLTFTFSIVRRINRPKPPACAAFCIGFLGSFIFQFAPDTSRIYGSLLACPICPPLGYGFLFESQMLGQALYYGLACGLVYAAIVCAIQFLVGSLKRKVLISEIPQ